MIIGVPKELKDHEARVGLIPGDVRALVESGHTVLIEKGAGEKGGFPDEEYVAAGAEMIDEQAEVWARAEFIAKVKEVLPEQFKYLREGQIIGAGLHSNAHPDEVDAFLEKNIIGIAYEDFTDKKGGSPAIVPQSQIAGAGAFFMAASFLCSANGGPGKMLANITGTSKAHITVIGAGHAGIGAAQVAAALGNDVTMLDISFDAMEAARARLPEGVEFLYSTKTNIEYCLKKTDVLINCVMWPKHRTDYLVDREMLRKYAKKTLFIADVASDIDGALETCIKATSHSDPLYVEEGIVHYTVDNIPAGFGQKSAQTFTQPIFPFIKEIADKGAVQALKDNKYLRTGLTTYEGQLTLRETGLKQNREFKTPEEVLGIE